MLETEVEPEWDDHQRARQLALGRYRVGVCECGFHESLTKVETGNHFTFDVRACPVCRGAAQMARRLEAQDERFVKALGDDPVPEAARPGDGRRVFTRLMTPDEVEQVRAARSH